MAAWAPDRALEQRGQHGNVFSRHNLLTDLRWQNIVAYVHSTFRHPATAYEVKQILHMNRWDMELKTCYYLYTTPETQNG